jgi:hypothetical protein
MTHYARKIDGNHAEVRDALRGVPGVRVKDVSMHAALGFDLIVVYQDGPPHLLEVKPPGRVKLTDSERGARAMYGDFWHCVQTFEDGLRALGIATERSPF